MTDVTDPAPTVAQTELLCPACGGQCHYSPSRQALECDSCRSVHEIRVDADADPTREFHYHPDLPHTEQPVISGTRPHQCRTCGGEVIFTGASLSERCPYCDGALVEQAQDESYEALGLIPFHVSEPEAQTFAQDWVARRWAAPDDLAGIVGKGRVAGIYVPFWTFDSKEAVDYMVKYRVKQGDNWVTRRIHGSMNTVFDDMLMPASPHVTPLIRDGILHDFDPDSLVPFEPAYLAGFAAERHHQSVTEGLEANAGDKDLLLRNRIKRHSGKSRISYIGYKTHTTGLTYRRILLPVWILHYRYDDRPMKVVTCGLHGRTFGERPFSTAKLLLYSAALAGICVAIGFLWGASGML